MKHFSGFDNIFEIEAWYFWGNMKVLLGHLDWELGTKGLHCDSAVKTFWVCILPAIFFIYLFIYLFIYFSFKSLFTVGIQK